MRFYAKFGIFALLAAVALPQARSVPARIVLPDGQEQVGVFEKLASDTVYYQIGEGDSVQSLTVYKFDVKKIQILEDSSLVDLSLTNYSYSKEAPKDTLKVEAPTLAKGKAVLVVNSFPQDARVYVDNILLEGLTPLVIPEIEGKKHHIMVRKFLKGVDWWGSAQVLPKDGDTTKVQIKLLKPHTQISVQSNPTEAEVYIDVQPSTSLMPTIMTDTTLIDVRPSVETTITLFKVGYYDTTITMPIEAYMPNIVGIELHAITDDLPKLQGQLDFVNERKNKWIGRGLLWSAIAPFVAGCTMVVLAELDWRKAVDYKTSYQDAAFQSSETDRFIKQNKKYNDSGDLKAKIGAGLGGAALLLAGAGIVLQF